VGDNLELCRNNPVAKRLKFSETKEVVIYVVA